jgi:flavorubredoxin
VCLRSFPTRGVAYIDRTITERTYDKAQALEQGPMKVLVCAATKYGATSEIAQAIAEKTMSGCAAYTCVIA